MEIKQKKIAVLGFPGSGKTTFSQALAERLKVPFLDLDTYIETKEHQNISKIFEEKGENYFREKEKFYLKKATEISPLILALGGGTPCFFNNASWIRQNFFAIYLKIPKNVLYLRLKNDRNHRPLLQNLSDLELQNWIDQHLKIREKMYEQACQFILDSEDLSQMLDKICIHLI